MLHLFGNLLGSTVLKVRVATFDREEILCPLGSLSGITELTSTPSCEQLYTGMSVALLSAEWNIFFEKQKGEKLSL